MFVLRGAMPRSMYTCENSRVLAIRSGCKHCFYAFAYQEALRPYPVVVFHSKLPLSLSACRLFYPYVCFLSEPFCLLLVIRFTKSLYIQFLHYSLCYVRACCYIIMCITCGSSVIMPSHKVHFIILHTYYILLAFY